MSQQENPPKTAAEVKADPQLEKYRIKKAFWLAIGGLTIAALLVIVLLAYGFKTSNDIVAVVGLFTSVLGTLVGAFFGLQIGAAGKEQTEKRIDSLLEKSEIDIIEKAKKAFPEAFKK